MSLPLDGPRAVPPERCSLLHAGRALDERDGDAAVPAALWLAWAHPWAFFAALALALALMAVLLWKLGGFLGQLLRRLGGGAGGSVPTT